MHSYRPVDLPIRAYSKLEKFESRIFTRMTWNAIGMRTLLRLIDRCHAPAISEPKAQPQLLQRWLGV